VPALVAGADAVAIPSRPGWKGIRESFSYVAAEALALGTPVVAYAEGGLPEVVGECGLLVEPGDTAGFASALVRVLRDRVLRERLVACGRARAAERFSIGKTAAAYAAAYREAARR
jgi:glycosyltransferase involved in cell wall biosynthesis